MNAVLIKYLRKAHAIRGRSIIRQMSIVTPPTSPAADLTPGSSQPPAPTSHPIPSMHIPLRYSCLCRLWEGPHEAHTWE